MKSCILLPVGCVRLNHFSQLTEVWDHRGFLSCVNTLFSAQIQNQQWQLIFFHFLWHHWISYVLHLEAWRSNFPVHWFATKTLSECTVKQIQAAIRNFMSETGTLCRKLELYVGNRNFRFVKFNSMVAICSVWLFEKILYITHWSRKFSHLEAKWFLWALRLLVINRGLYLEPIAPLWIGSNKIFPFYSIDNYSMSCCFAIFWWHHLISSLFYTWIVPVIGPVISHRTSHK